MFFFLYVTTKTESKGNIDKNKRQAKNYSHNGKISRPIRKYKKE